MSLLAPTRPSWKPPLFPSVSTQRMRPLCTAWASHFTLTSLSRPEKPPMPATLVPDVMIEAAAPSWLDTATVPPPCAFTYLDTAVRDELSEPNGPPRPPAPGVPFPAEPGVPPVPLGGVKPPPALGGAPKPPCADPPPGT